MNLNLAEKVVIVTGGSKGIGEAITRTLVMEGAIPVVATRSEQATVSLTRELESEGLTLHSVLGDLEDAEFCRSVVFSAITRFGRIDGIVNNAGINDGVGLEDGPDAFRQSIRRNLNHYYDLVHFALPHLKISKGSIVNISSKVAVTGQGRTSGYAAAKGAQLALTREWAAALLPYSIRVNAILPAEVMTPLYRRWLDSTFQDPAGKEEEIRAKIPLEKRMTTAQEIASM
ncbi:MAG: SDR family oxidoreductase, partial [Saprospiraceae bacterium]|nr:SDR family oxidoreductase [Saprospiraceae bacterium]